MIFKSSVLAVITFFGSLAIAQAQASRTWVSGVGDDANPCSRTAPCKTFAGAISKTAAGGEIDALDPGGFGAVTITKAITIDGGGSLASVLVSGTNGIVVSAGASDVVTIRNIAVNGIGTGVNGIRFLSGGALHVERCVIFGFAGTGIDAEPAGSSQLFVLDTVVRDNGGSGILIRPGGSGVQAMLDGVRLDGNFYGVRAESKAYATIRNSVASGNIAGFQAVSTGTGAQINLENSTAVSNGTGVATSGGTAYIFMSNSTIMSNSRGIDNSTGGNVYSFGDNRIFANGTTGTLTGTLSLE